MSIGSKRSNEGFLLLELLIASVFMLMMSMVIVRGSGSLISWQKDAINRRHALELLDTTALELAVGLKKGAQTFSKEGCTIAIKQIPWARGHGDFHAPLYKLEASWHIGSMQRTAYCYAGGMA